MSRIERKKAEKIKYRSKGRKVLSIGCILILLATGIKAVDDVARSALMIEEPRVFGHKKIDEDLHQVYFCGEKFYINEGQIRQKYTYLKNGVEIFIKMLKDKKNQFVKKDE